MDTLVGTERFLRNIRCTGRRLLAPHAGETVYGWAIGAKLGMESFLCQVGLGHGLGHLYD